MWPFTHCSSRTMKCMQCTPHPLREQSHYSAPIQLLYAFFYVPCAKIQTKVNWWHANWNLIAWSKFNRRLSIEFLCVMAYEQHSNIWKSRWQQNAWCSFAIQSCFVAIQFCVFVNTWPCTCDAVYDTQNWQIEPIGWQPLMPGRTDEFEIQHLQSCH